MSFESGKNMTGIGALFLVIGTFVPFLSLVGIILLLVGLKDLAKYYNDDTIFQNSLYAVIFGIIGIIAAGIALILLFMGQFYSAGIIVPLVVIFIFYILMALYFRKTFESLAEKTGQGMFNTAGLLLLIGAILTIVLVGLILIFVAWILATVAFFSMTPTTTRQQPPPPPPPPQT